ncbi:MAG: branched-chain amino acid ABC transporter permease, partial [Nitriliruptorales bacterium]|nr:branched-chain amino acid ABC transporter permease [Nitriliruptorales bacterium]
MEASTKRLLTRAALVVGVLGLIAIQVFAEGVSLLAAFANSLQSGAIYALVGLGLVLVYRATGVLNFAQGELGTIPAFIVLMILLARGHTRTLPGLESAGLLEKELDPALISGLELFGWTIVAILVGALLAVGVYWVVIKRLQDASPVISLVATAGVALLFTQAEILFFEARIRKFPRFIDNAPCLSGGEGDVCETPLTFFGTTTIQWHTLVIVLVLAIAAVLLALFFRTPAGVALLATAQEPFAASLHGISVQAMAMTAWAAAGALAAVAGVLAAGAGEALSPGLMTSTFLIPAFTGAVLGGLDSMPGAVVGGL